MKKELKLTANNVHETFLECLFKEGEETSNHKIGNGVMMNVGFHPDRLDSKAELITMMLDDLPDSFKKSVGGGMSFLNMCVDKNETQWADMHKTVDELVCLGTAIGKVTFCMPKEMWSALPGGMPYISID